ncbi:MAG: MATE family efflux transporter [Xanthomonadales bacterium]|nr:MATE family efflux transporter [Xanthomonadales bacterium]
MHNLTEGSINRHLVLMAIPMAIGMAVQVLYNLIDIYFVAQLGDAAIAGVSAGANIMFLVLAFNQILNVGTVALIARAAGANDQQKASLVFNQSLSVSIVMGVLVLVVGLLVAAPYMRAMGSDEATIAAGITYLHWFMPALALQFAMVSMGAALRGIGVVKPTMLIQILSVVLNAILASILIIGWGTGIPLGVAGAGLASTLAVIASVIMLGWYFVRHSHYVKFRRDMLAFDWQQIKRIVGIGLPIGGEFFLMFVYLVVVYWVIKDFGSAAQAGFGIGMRVMQSFFLPVMAVSFAMPAIIGQNLGAGLPARVRQTFFNALLLECVLMSLVMLICKWHPDLLIAIFSDEAEVILFGAEFLSIISWNFLGMGVVFACSGYFQGVGNTWPALLSTTVRMLLFAIPAVWLSFREGFNTAQLWYLSVATVIVQMLLSLVLVRRSLRKYAPA